MFQKETICGKFLHDGEYEARLDDVFTTIDRAQQACGERSLEWTDLEYMRKGVRLVCNALRGCWRSGILVDSVPVYNLGIVDRAGRDCGAGGCGCGGGDPLEEKQGRYGEGEV